MTVKFCWLFFKIYDDKGEDENNGMKRLTDLSWMQMLKDCKKVKEEKMVKFLILQV